MVAADGYHCFPTSASLLCTITQDVTTTRNRVLGALQSRRGKLEHHPIPFTYSRIAALSSVLGLIGVIVANVHSFIFLLYSSLVHTLCGYLVQRREAEPVAI
jgi:hypothetical protein